MKPQWLKKLAARRAEDEETYRRRLANSVCVEKAVEEAQGWVPDMPGPQLYRDLAAASLEQTMAWVKRASISDWNAS